MTSQGTAYGQFRRALEHRDAAHALSVAADLPRLGLADALALCLIIRDDPDRFARAAPRWLGRYVVETKATLAESQLVLAALAAIGEADECGRRALASVLAARKRHDLLKALERYW